MDSFYNYGPVIACRRTSGDLPNGWDIATTIKDKRLMYWPAGETNEWDCWLPEAEVDVPMEQDRPLRGEFFDQLENKGFWEIKGFNKCMVESWMEETFAKVIDELKKIYGEDNVEIKVGWMFGSS